MMKIDEVSNKSDGKEVLFALGSDIAWHNHQAGRPRHASTLVTVSGAMADAHNSPPDMTQAYTYWEYLCIDADPRDDVALVFDDGLERGARERDRSVRRKIQTAD